MKINKLAKLMVPLLVLSSYVSADTNSGEVVIDHSLYPPLSTGEASPWENDTGEDKQEGLTDNPWAGAQQAPLTNQPYYNYQQPQYNTGQYQTPYVQTPIQPYYTYPQGQVPGVVPGVVPVYPQPYAPVMPYGGYGYPGGGYYPPGGYNNNGPFDFSMPWPF